MKKLVIFLLLTLSLTCGFRHQKGIILFNTQPINKNNVLTDSKIFNQGQKVYYLFIAPKRMKNKFIRVQIFKLTDKAALGGAEVVRTKDFRLMKDERYYHSNYFVIHTKGRYIMQVFSTDDFQYPLALGEFYVK